MFREPASSSASLDSESRVSFVSMDEWVNGSEAAESSVIRCAADPHVAPS